MDGPYKQDFHVRNLPTRSVTLFPTRAQIVREIKQVSLKPGSNEITVVGVTPTADEHSIKVEGTGSATITDISVELLPNRDIFQEIYPDSDSEQDEDESEEDDDDQEKANVAIEEVREKLAALKDEQKAAKEIIASAESRLKIIDSYSNSLHPRDGVDIEASVETYRKEREKVFRDHVDGTARERAVAKEIATLQREATRLDKLQAKEKKKAAKEKAKIWKAKEKLREKQRRRDDEQKKEKLRIRKEREQFWPRSCYSVRITLDAGANFTPGSSRRSSIASAADVQVASKYPKDDEASMICDLTISYVTSSAFWAPSYDLSLSSTTNTATLSFDARLTNMTSETWANSKVTLSTSQANFSGLQDDTPTLVPWRLKVVGKGGPWDGQDIAHSHEERNEKNVWNAQQNAMVAQRPRAGLFGLGQAQPMQQQMQQQMQQLNHVMASHKAPVPPQAQNVDFGMRTFFASGSNANAISNTVAHTDNIQTESAFGRAAPQSRPAPAASLFGGAARQVGPAATGGLFGGAAPRSTGFAQPSTVNPTAFGRSQTEEVSTANEEYSAPGANNPDDFDAQTMLEPIPELTFQDSSFEETGLTATYDLPHTKTLKPSPTPSKQRVARVSFTNVTFSRTVVAKYKPAAYLRARLRNTSKLTLLRGPTGLTLDGTFLGRSTLPRCSAGDGFHVPLGVDPAIRVSYPKPDVARSTTGVFTKGENSVYTRTVTLVNTRAAAGKAVGVTVLDQVPVPEDEKIRVDVLQPAGLGASGGGKVVAAGMPGREGKEELDWGKATASLKKAGEVQWEVSLNAGRSVKLVLQYEVAFPTGERVAQVY
ncbi:hypothetical protein CHGG_04962 [Chaetomium globosum CBS 148.51]|uniref:DUF4139 domain-containing protein n=1 Tax=Chaetomium globosum (strain ATCC 6205 / CBS 148.51 / DSM 1962 / NBRC 6347 / NRRL 1970) TaxID=306901 RepID=Q2GZT4_CHAGB|nr:uncharacterized protein CHGG_04962 [Chaetomium globosum CBS 148.51]EAQ88343.1 hypothetical protein CHGG_04962 [Chaetomium globosum CBS 148.51]